MLGTLALLGTVFFPALARSGDHATRAVCLANLRQMGQASLMYANDNGESFPLANWGNSAAGWLYTPVNGSPPNPPGGCETGQWFKYVQSRQRYLCPVDMESRYYSARANKLSSYVMNGAVIGYGVSTRPCKVTDAWSPACYLLWEPDENFGSPPAGAFAFNDASSYPDRSEGPGRLHSAIGTTVVTVGGEAQFVTFQRFQAEQNSGKKSLTWWDPASSNGR
jgi:hypothetical protein